MLHVRSPRASTLAARTSATLASLVLCLAPLACSPGSVLDDEPAPDGTPLPPPPLDFGVVTSPRTGDAIADHADAARVEIEGLHTLPDQLVEVLALVAPYDAATSWQVVGSGRTEAVAQPAADDQPRYRYAITIDARALWPRAGLLALRVRAADRDLTGFFADADACWATAGSWRDRVPSCGNPFAARGIVLVSTDLDDAERAAADEIYLADKGDSATTDTAAYYQAIDAPPTLSAFRTRYMIADAAAMTYYNAGDLGIGREMHCASFPATAGAGVACYVSNYGAFGGSPTEALALTLDGARAGGNQGEFATVAMVYRPPIDAPNAVQFIVYGPDEQLALAAPLDTHGDNVAIPNNCLNCHGSHAGYDLATHTVRDARFLPFDPDAFTFATDSGYRRADQEEALRWLNQLVLRTEPPAAMAALVRDMYAGRGGIDARGATADADVIPAGWSTPGMREAYREVVKPFCRSCHLSREDGGGAELYDLGDGARMLAIATTVGNVVCGGGNARVHRMPSAEATQRAFWAGPARAYLGAMIDLRGPCTP